MSGQDTANEPENWGQLIRSSRNGRVHIYELDLGRGRRIFTHVFWADPERDSRRGHDAITRARAASAARARVFEPANPRTPALPRHANRRQHPLLSATVQHRDLDNVVAGTER